MTNNPTATTLPTYHAEEIVLLVGVQTCGSIDKDPADQISLNEDTESSYAPPITKILSSCTTHPNAVRAIQPASSSIKSQVEPSDVDQTSLNLDDAFLPPLQRSFYHTQHFHGTCDH